MVPPHFCLLKEMVESQEEMSDQCLTAEQTKQIYDKTETGEMVNIRKVNRQDVQNTPK